MPPPPPQDTIIICACVPSYVCLGSPQCIWTTLRIRAKDVNNYPNHTEGACR
jgi:hypothetical protein